MDSNTIFRNVELEGQRPPTASGLKSVLILDADFREGGMIRNSLEACGYEVSVWTGVENALERLKARHYDLVIFSTNIGQKSMDALLEDLRAKRQPPKVILIADEDEGDAAARCFLRFLMVLNRPFQLSDLADMVGHLIGNP